MKVLGIDTTADDTCAAVVEDGREILSSIVFSQSNLHEKYGGIVPQIAAHEHLKAVIPAVEASLKEADTRLSKIDLFTVGQSPDEALNYYLIGLNTAKVFSAVFARPLVGVDHVESHILANFAGNPGLKFPFVCLTVAGGHTILAFIQDFGIYEVLGSTRDDAAGEAFDKVARILGLGYPGGPAIDKAAENGNEDAYALPRPMINNPSFDFSYAGLKTAAFYLVKYLRERYAGDLPASVVNDIAAGFRKAAVAVLLEKIFRAAHLKKTETVVLGGGVAANFLLRKLAVERGEREGIRVYIPPVRLCTDNAVGTAVAGFYKFRRCGGDDLLSLKHFRQRPLMNWKILKDSVEG